MVIDYAALAATLVALLAGWLTIKHCRHLLHQGIELGDGGGHAVLILVEFSACMAAVALAVNV